MTERKSVIPEWCGKSARHPMENFGFDPAVLEGAIAAALHTERERCAKIAEGLSGNKAQYANFDGGYETACEEIAKAIRDGVAE